MVCLALTKSVHTGSAVHEHNVVMYAGYFADRHWLIRRFAAATKSTD